MWVIEMLGYMQDMPATNERDPIGRISVLEDTNNDGRMDKKTVFLDGLVLPRALKVLDRGVLVAEPPHLWLARDTNGDLKADSKELVCDCYGTALAQRRAQRERPALGDRQLDAHVGRRHLLPPEGRASSRRGRRCRAASGARRRTTSAASIATRTARRCMSTSCRRRTSLGNPNLAPHARQLRVRGRSERAERDVSDAAESRRQSRLLDGQLRADGTLATYTGVCAPTVYRGDRLPAGAARQRLRRRADRQSRQPHHRQRRRHEAARAEGVRQRGVPGVDRRAVPARLSVVRAGRHDLRRRHVSRHHPAQGLHHRVPARSHRREEARERRSTWAASSGSCTTRRGATRRRRSRPSRRRSWSSRLAHPNGWWRDTAQQLLVERGDTSVAGALNEAGREARRMCARGCTRCGRSMVSTDSSRPR